MNATVVPMKIEGRSGCAAPRPHRRSGARGHRARPGVGLRPRRRRRGGSPGSMRQRRAHPGHPDHLPVRSPNLSLRYTERLAQAGVEPSVGRVGDSYDNAMAESIIGGPRPDSSSGAVPGGASKRSSSLPSNGSTGTTIDGSSGRSNTFPQRRRRHTTSANCSSRPSRPDSSKSPSGIPGAVHSVSSRACCSCSLAKLLMRPPFGRLPFGCGQGTRPGAGSGELVELIDLLNMTPSLSLATNASLGER